MRKKVPIKRIITSIASGNALPKENLLENGSYPVYGGGAQIGTYSAYNCNNVVLVGRVGSCGHVTLLEGYGWATDNALVLKTEHNLKYLSYVLDTLDITPLISATAMPLLTGGKLKEAVVEFEFDSDIQKSTVLYLDTTCYKITEAISRHQSIIEKLEKYKKSIITQAVTKGLNPDAEMKDSGIGWIGNVPRNWNVVKNKFIFTIKKDIARKEEYTVLSITQRGIIPKNLENNEGQLAANYSNYQLVNIGDFAMNHMDLLTGWVDISKYEGVTSPDYRVFYITEPTKHYAPYYLYVMQLCYFNRIFYGLGAGVSGFGRWRLQAPEFLNFKVPIPPIDEQIEIAKYLDDKCLKIDDAISRQRSAIEKLEEYRKSLIYNAVTGKIDCREAVYEA